MRRDAALASPVSRCVSAASACPLVPRRGSSHLRREAKARGDGLGGFARAPRACSPWWLPFNCCWCCRRRPMFRASYSGCPSLTLSVDARCPRVRSHTRAPQPRPRTCQGSTGGSLPGPLSYPLDLTPLLSARSRAREPTRDRALYCPALSARPHRAFLRCRDLHRIRTYARDRTLCEAPLHRLFLATPRNPR